MAVGKNITLKGTGKQYDHPEGVGKNINWRREEKDGNLGKKIWRLGRISS